MSKWFTVDETIKENVHQEEPSIEDAHMEDVELPSLKESLIDARDTLLELLDLVESLLDTLTATIMERSSSGI
jgi:hypothetical protein